jgi:hypothetical protein
MKTNTSLAVCFQKNAGSRRSSLKFCGIHMGILEGKAAATFVLSISNLDAKL